MKIAGDPKFDPQIETYTGLLSAFGWNYKKVQMWNIF